MGRSTDIGNARQEETTFTGPLFLTGVLAFFRFAFAIALVWVLLSEGDRLGTLAIILFAIAVPFLLVTGAAEIRNLMKPPPRLILSGDGLWIGMKYSDDRYIKWEDIAALKRGRYWGTDVIGIERKGAEGKGSLPMRGEHFTEFPAIAISSGMVSVPLKTIEAEIRRRMPA